MKNNSFRRSILLAITLFVVFTLELVLKASDLWILGDLQICIIAGLILMTRGEYIYGALFILFTTVISSSLDLNLLGVTTLIFFGIVTITGIIRHFLKNRFISHSFELLIVLVIFLVIDAIFLKHEVLNLLILMTIVVNLFIAVLSLRLIEIYSKTGDKYKFPKNKI